MPIPGSAPDPETLLADDRFVRSLARLLVSDAHLAEDVAQQTWVAALEHPPRKRGPLRSWLAAVGRNFARRIGRGEVRRLRREHAAARPEALPSTAEIVAREETRRRIVEAVLALEEPYRSTIVLRFLEGLPPREIARRSGVPKATVRTRIRRALEFLRRNLDAREGGRGRGAWMAAVAAFAMPRGVAVAPTGTPLVPVTGGVLVSSTLKIMIGAAVLATLGATLTIRGTESRESVPAAESSPILARTEATTGPPLADSPSLPSGIERTSREALVVDPPEEPAGDSAPTPDLILSRLDRLAATFLTEQPDLVGFNEFVRSLSVSARVLPESIETIDGELVKGEFGVDGTGLRASFEIEDDRYAVRLGNPRLRALSPPEVALAPPFARLFVSFGFREDQGIPDKAHLNVQYHPDTRRSARTSGLEDGETRLSGYTVSISTEGAKAEPILVRPSGRSWQIGRLDGVQAELVEGPPYDASAFDPWLRLLRPYAP